ncbi:MAG: Spo0E family sporulation regulatory protein-aspartic acid phosphatase [Tissierella sp.]|nr:Spo0E family sporulation regulatory protein-aspartic acid phosphatase [Tissierella sp.]
MKEDEDLSELEQKINNERKKLDSLVLEGLDKDNLLKLSCELDELINEYYRLILRKSS